MERGYHDFECIGDIPQHNIPQIMILPNALIISSKVLNPPQCTKCIQDIPHTNHDFPHALMISPNALHTRYTGYGCCYWHMQKHAKSSTVNFLSLQKSLASSLRIIVDHFSLLWSLRRVIATWLKIFNYFAISGEQMPRSKTSR